MTTLIGVRTDNEVILAADSKIGMSAEDVMKDGGSKCKIEQAGDLYYGTTGMYKNEATSFDAHDFVLAAMNAGPETLNIVNEFHKAIAAPLLDAVRNIRLTSPNVYRTRLKNGQPLEAFFGSCENNIPALYYRGFSLGDISRKVSRRKKFVTNRLKRINPASNYIFFGPILFAELKRA